MRILIIEDDAGIAELIRFELEDSGYETVWVSSFAEADSVLEVNDVKLMLVDYKLSGDENAREWLQERKSKHLPVPPFIMSTGQGDERVAVEMMKLGARDYLVKDTMLITRLPDVIRRVWKDIENENKLKEADELIQKQLQFTQLLMNISTSFINLPLSEVEDAVHNSLAEISTFVNADQSYIIYYDFKNQIANIDYEWCNKGFSPRKKIYQTIPMEKMDNWVPTHLKGEVVYVYDINNYDQKNVFEAVSVYGIKSIIAIPMMDNGKCLGYVSFDSIRENHIYTESEQNLFKVFAQLLVNIYKRRQYVEELRLSGEKYRLLFEYNPEPMWIFELDTLKFLEVNDAAVEHYGYSREEFLSMTLKDIRPEEDMNLLISNLSLMLKKNRSRVYARHLKKSGEFIFVELTTVQITWNGKKAIHILVNDVTEKKITQEKLQEKRDILKKVLDESTGFIQSQLSDVDFTKITDMMLEISGASVVAFNQYESNGTDYMTKSISGIGDFVRNSMNILGFNLLEKKWKADPFINTNSDRKLIHKFSGISEIVDKVFPKSVVKIIENTFNTGQVVVVSTCNDNQILGDFVLIFTKGKELKNHEIAELFSSQVGQFLIRIESEKAVRTSEEKYRYLFENNPQPMWIYDVDSLAFLEVNNAAITHYGFSRKDFLSMTLFDICPPDDIPEFVKSIATIKDKTDHLSRRRHLTKNEEVIYVELTSTPIKFENRNARHVLVNDVTKRKKMEDELNRKMNELLKN
ncbi:MAG: PAS domain S-box protein [Paludibacter sp.]|nr:PAS domain S-box protein [Paludibacter sp.]MDD4198328.1 PAS domain S-box protein [Paludibacter sp.]MDD4428069.1 PAS domain S-box protein [Paludibacter sp.]